MMVVLLIIMLIMMEANGDLIGRKAAEKVWEGTK